MCGVRLGRGGGASWGPRRTPGAAGRGAVSAAGGSWRRAPTEWVPLLVVAVRAAPRAGRQEHGDRRRACTGEPARSTVR